MIMIIGLKEKETGSNDGSFLIDETYEDPETHSLTNSIGILNVGSFRTLYISNLVNKIVRFKSLFLF